MNGSILVEAGSPIAGISLESGDTLPTTNYEISLDAKRIEGSDFFCGLTFPVRDSHCSLIVAGHGGRIVGLSEVDGNDHSSNDTTRYRNFEDDIWYAIRVRVTDESITCWIDDEQIIQQTLSGHRISTPSLAEAFRPMGLSAFESKVAYRNIVFTYDLPLETNESGSTAGLHKKPDSLRFAQDESSLSQSDFVKRAESVLGNFYMNTADYTATLKSQVKVDGRLQAEQVRLVKIRLGKGNVKSPTSVYFKQVEPTKKTGQEAIWVVNKNDNMQLSHVSGLMNFTTIKLKPDSNIAMLGNKLPINKLGMGNLVTRFIENVKNNPKGILKLEEVRDAMRFSVVHSDRNDNSDYQRIELRVESKSNHPVRFEAYGWPKNPGDDPPLLERFIYEDIAVNPGLTSDDFDPSNSEYNFPSD